MLNNATGHGSVHRKSIGNLPSSPTRLYFPSSNSAMQSGPQCALHRVCWSSGPRWQGQACHSHRLAEKVRFWKGMRKGWAMERDRGDPCLCMERQMSSSQGNVVARALKKLNPSNYRPISLLSVLERHMSNLLYDHNTCAETHFGDGVMSPCVSPLSAIARAHDPAV